MGHSPTKLTACLARHVRCSCMVYSKYFYRPCMDQGVAVLLRGPVGVLLAVLLVDRVGRLPLLKASSSMAVVIVTALVAMAITYSYEMHKEMWGTKLPVPKRWPLFQLATLSILAVSAYWGLTFFASTKQLDLGHSQLG